jgi:hypothetical protein
MHELEGFLFVAQYEQNFTHTYTWVIKIHNPYLGIYIYRYGIHMHVCKVDSLNTQALLFGYMKLSIRHITVRLLISH